MQQLLLWLGLLELLSGVPAVIQTLKGSEVGFNCALCDAAREARVSTLNLCLVMPRPGTLANTTLTLRLLLVLPTAHARRLRL